MKTAKVFADRIKLRWEPPLADGGSEITNYIIEKRETSRPNWALVTANISGHSTDCSVERLIEGHEYQFRVSAENQYGVGDARMTEPVMVKNPYGTFTPLKHRILTTLSCTEAHLKNTKYSKKETFPHELTVLLTSETFSDMSHQIHDKKHMSSRI